MFGSMNTYTSMLDKSLEAEKISVSVIGENIVVVDDDCFYVSGTGPFGLALASRLSEAGAELRLGTRDMNSVRCEVPGAVRLVSNKVRHKTVSTTLPADHDHSCVMILHCFG